MAKRKIYPEKFKDNACKLVTGDGMSVNESAKKLKVSPAMLRRWLKKQDAKTSKVKSPSLATELETKIQQLQDEISILERALEILG